MTASECVRKIYKTLGISLITICINKDNVPQYCVVPQVFLEEAQAAIEECWERNGPDPAEIRRVLNTPHYCVPVVQPRLGTVLERIYKTLSISTVSVVVDGTTRTVLAPNQCQAAGLSFDEVDLNEMKEAKVAKIPKLAIIMRPFYMATDFTEIEKTLAGLCNAKYISVDAPNLAPAGSRVIVLMGDVTTETTLAQLRLYV